MWEVATNQRLSFCGQSNVHYVKSLASNESMLTPAIRESSSSPASGEEKTLPGGGSFVAASAAQTRIERIRASQREWRKNNSARQKELVSRWKKSHPDKVKLHKKRGKEVFERSLLRLVEAQGWLCKLCGVRLGVDRHLDHIQPKSRGGRNVMSNFQFLCPTCNLSKGALTNEEFLDHIRKILAYRSL